MYVCMYVRMYVRMYVCMYVCNTYKHTYVQSFILLLYSIYQKDARSIFLYVLHHFAEDFQLFFSSEGQAERCVHMY